MLLWSFTRILNCQSHPDIFWYFLKMPTLLRGNYILHSHAIFCYKEGTVSYHTGQYGVTEVSPMFNARDLNDFGVFCSLL